MSIAEREDTLALYSCKANPEEEDGEYHSDKNSVDLLSPNKKRVSNVKSVTMQQKIFAAKTSKTAVIEETKT